MFDPISFSILWSRLLALVDEAGSTLQRTSFSTVTRESNDFAVVLMDAEGRGIAQSSISVPSFLGVIPMLTKSLLAGDFPAESWQEGDVVMTNDPWLCAGHKPDIGIVSPIFYQEKLIGFMGTIAHSPDMGGVLWGAGARNFYEEGLYVAPMKLYSKGIANETLFTVIESNVRASRQTLGDIRAQVAANEQGARSLIRLMQESDLVDLAQLSTQIRGASEKAMREALQQAPNGTFHYTYQADGDGLGDDVEIQIAITIKNDEICVDYTGTRATHKLAINAVLNYVYAYTAYPIKCIFSPDVPNNDGAFAPIFVSAPEGSMLNAQKPAPLGARNITGNMLHAAVFGALAQAVPNKVQADCGCPCWCIVLNGTHPDRDSAEFVEYFFVNGGYGARPNRDGDNVYSFPTNVANVPTEVLEHDAPIRILEKNLIENSGGDGEFRGGLGQKMVFEVVGNQKVNLSLLTEKVTTVAHGILGGENGKMGAVAISSDKFIPPKGLMELEPGDIITLELPGGGGYGNPEQRSADARQLDEAMGYVATSIK